MPYRNCPIAKDGLCLHRGNLRICNAKAATSKTQHGVNLGKRSHTLLDELQARAHLLRHRLLTFQVMWHELVERWVKESDVHRHSIHALQDAIEVVFLQRKKLGKGNLATSLVVGENHLAHGLNLVVVEEHVLRTAQPNADGAKFLCDLSIMWGVSVSANHHAGVLIAKLHEFREIA